MAKDEDDWGGSDMGMGFNIYVDVAGVGEEAFVRENLWLLFAR